MRNPEGMRFCGGCGNPLPTDDVPRDVDAGDGAQRRHMTVMFCDLVGSTPLAEELDPEDLREVILSFQDAAARAIERFDGRIARYMGDGILVYFGYPRAHEDDAQRAVRAGLAIIEAIEQLNRRLVERYAVELHVRIGVHSGLVVAGEMGGGTTRDELAIVGETPNIAARLESIAAPDTMAISNSTLELTEGFFEVAPIHGRDLKGVSRKVEPYRVIATTGAQHRLDVASAGRANAMIGRRDELDRVATAWDGVRSGTGAVVHIRGEAGIGKSRFVQAIRDRLGGEVGDEQVWRCSAYHQSSALFPVVDHIERSLRDDEDVLGAVAAMLDAAGLDVDDALPHLARLLSVDYRDPRDRPPLRALDARAATMRVLETLLVNDPTRHPLLLIVEDLHWADPTTIELLQRIVQIVPSHAVLAAFTFRQDFVPPWAEDERLEDIELRPLSADEVTAMAAGVGEAGFDPDVIARVVEASDGVPLFVEEMMKMVGTGGAATATDGIAVPTSLRGLLAERLDRLPDLRAVIDAVAVVGRDISRELLDGLAAFRRLDVDAALDALVTNDILRAQSDGSSSYEFSHALLHEAAYDSVLRARRQSLHLQVAGALVERVPARAEREPEVVAHHFMRAGEPLSAVPHWYAAGLRALERAAFIEAADHFGRGADALDVDPSSVDEAQRAEFLSHRAASLQAGCGYAAPGVDDAYSEARISCTRARRDDRLVSVIRGLWMFHLLRAEYDTALELANEMLALCGRTGRQEDLAEGSLFRGMVHMYRGELVASRSAFEQAIDRYHPHQAPDRVYEAQGDTGVGALAYLAPVLANLGYVEDATTRSDECLVLADSVGGAVTKAQAWGMRSLLQFGQNDDALRMWAERTLEHSAEHNVQYWKNISELIVAWMRGRAGAVDDGIAGIEAGMERYFDSGSRLGTPLFRMMLADLLHRAGDRQRALVELTAGEMFIDGTGERWSEPQLHMLKAQTLLTGGGADPVGAHQALVDALAAARFQHAKLLELRAATFLTTLELGTRQPCSELDALAELCDWFPESSGDAAMARNVLANARGAR